MNLHHLVAAAVVGLTLTAPAQAATIVLNNVDAPGIGFNDLTPATAVGGNTGSTVGAQRLVAYRKALELWGKTLHSDATIVVRGSFARLNCAGGVLAQAGALQIFENFPNAPLKNHWYGVALANSIAGGDLAPGPLDVPGQAADPADDIIASFNGDLGKADCLPGSTWYYGLDNNAGPGQIDFLDTFMHEVSHGLGFQNFANELTGVTEEDTPDVYMANTLDLITGRLWNTMTRDEIRASAVRNGRVVWAGAIVNANAPLVLGPYQGIRLTGGVTKELEYSTASFGVPATAANFNGSVAVATDAGGSTLGCNPITAAVAGKIALMDRGTCGFVVKAKNAQNAGAIGAMIANNNGGSAIGLGGADVTVTIPTIGLSAADGAAIKAATSAVAVEFFTDPTRMAGATDGKVRLYAPTVVALGSSISHFDTVAAPNLLMEPSINPDLRSATNLDLTPSLMQDIGWKIETLKIGNCDTGVASILPTGQMLHVNVDACRASSGNHGQFVSCMNKVTNDAKTSNFLAGWQHAAIASCAARGLP